MSQPALPGLQAEPLLTPRQRFALAFVRAAGGPVSGELLGAALHEYRMSEGGRGHRADTRCRFCGQEGKDVGHALMRKGLLRYLRGEGFVDAEWKPEPEPSLQGDLPAGF